MIKSRLFYAFLVLLLLGGGVWLGYRPSDINKPDSQAESGGEADVVFAEESPAGREDLLRLDLPEPENVYGIDDEWIVRYPNASVVDSRMVRTTAGGVRFQQLLATESSRIPWVLWEYKLVPDEAGVFESVGSVAHMGNLFLVEAKPGIVSSDALEAFAADYGLFEERRSLVADYVCLGFDDPSLGKIEGLLSEFRKRFPRAIAEFDTLSFPSATPNDWDAARMWGLDKIDARAAWQFEDGEGPTDVVVAIIDTGTQRLHPDLVGNLFVNPGDPSANNRDDDGNGLIDDTSGWDFIDNDADPQDDDGHGTHVAGIASAVGNNGVGAVGVSWGVKFLPLKVGGGEGLRTSAINDALAYVSRLKLDGVNIVATNNSYGSGGASPSTRNEISKHEQLGVLFVAASGNDGKNMDASPASLEYPAGYTLDNIISVGNSNQEDTLNSSSNYGVTSVDLSAPGSEIYSTYPGNGYEFLTGTSMASPMVAGAVGLLSQAEPSLTAVELKARLIETADRLPSQAGLSVSGGRLNMLAALRPELSGHFVEVTNVTDAIVLLDSIDAEVVFETATHANSSVLATVFYGADVGGIESDGDGVFRFVPTTTGQAKIRFSASLEGVVRTVQKTVFVGDASSVDDGLLHHYSFDGSGVVESDLAGNSNGAIDGASRIATEYGRSLGFDAVTEQMTFDGQFSDIVTIAALVRFDDMQASPHPRVVNMPYYYLFFSSGDTAQFPDGNRQTLKFFSNFNDGIPDTGSPDFGIWNTPPRSVRNDQWYYIVGSYNSTNVLNTPSLYLNGEQQVARIQQAPRGSMDRTGGLSYLANNESGSRAFDGLMADVRIYNRALSPVEVSQLGAALTQDRWDGVEISAPPVAPIVDESVFFQIEDAGLSRASLRIDWYAEVDSGGEHLGSSGEGATFRFRVSGSHQVSAQVSDGVVTRVIQKVVKVADGRLTAGHYTGSNADGGLVWLEVDDSLRDGLITLYDPASGFYRIQERVTISEDGVFETRETSGGRISGTALRAFSAKVDGLDSVFDGELQPGPSSVSPFQGTFAGGGISIPGDSMQLQVLSDGRAFLWREGPFADLAFGSVGLDGKLVLTSASLENVRLAVDPSSGSVSGTWGDARAFLTEAGVASDARMLAGMVGGFPIGGGGFGLFSEFIEEGESDSGVLVSGALTELAGDVKAQGGLFTLDVSGRSQILDSEESTVARVAGAVKAGDIDLGLRVVKGVRLQAPITPGGQGVVAFSIDGTDPLEVLVRALGPSFTSEGVEDPIVSIYQLIDGEAVRLTPNDNWRDGVLFSDEDESAQGAFRALVTGFDALSLSQLADDAKDAALRVWLEPGDYLVLVELAAGKSGSGLLEVFAL